MAVNLYPAMSFNSVQFAAFFPIVTALYFLLPHRFRAAMLLAASCIFYMAFIPAYILILFITILIDYSAGIYIEKSSGKKRKVFLIISIISTCLVLFVFKYFNFFNGSFASIASFFDLHYPISMLKIILPIGLSFHTFQSLSYVIEVYRGKQKAERNFGIYSLYVMFYPQLVAGPIERPQNLLHQFREKHFFEYQRVVDGLKLMTWGLFKKIVIADRLAVAVNHVYGSPSDANGLTLIIATIFFAFQIYCDFSGYSDIAIGAAQVMGFKLMDNFNRPYLSQSISEFWKRWHISLSTWFRDYVYIPLGGNKATAARWNFNIFITFLLSGLWHGANWTFVIWGALNGFYLLFAAATKNTREAAAARLGLLKFPILYKWLQILTTFLLISFAWIFFRANTLHDAWYIVGHLGSGLGNIFSAGYIHTTIASLGLDLYELGIALAALLFLGYVERKEGGKTLRHLFANKSAVYRWGMYLVLLLALLFFGVSGNTAFIYFQF